MHNHSIQSFNIII